MPRNLDYPMPMHGRMMRQRLWELQQDASALYDTLRDDDRVPAWTLDKIATGGDRIGQVSRYLRFKASNPIAWGAATTAEQPKKRTVVDDLLTLGFFAGALFVGSAVMAYAAKSLDRPVPAGKKRKARRRPTRVHITKKKA
jgi:hypothetical protein